MHDRLRRIREVRQHGKSWRYRLDDGTSVSHEVILQSIARNALFQLRQEVMLGRNGWRTQLSSDQTRRSGRRILERSIRLMSNEVWSDESKCQRQASFH